jgi:hypothetical protein
MSFTCAAAMAFPALASAVYDSYYDPIIISNLNTPYTDAFNFYSDITPFGPHPSALYSSTSPEVLPDGQAEPTYCSNTDYGGTSHYGATAWYQIHPDTSGTVLLRVQPHPSYANAGFDAVIAVFQVNPSTGAPLRETAGCLDHARGTATEEGYFQVQAGQYWRIQIGGIDYGSGGEYDYHQYSLAFSPGSSSGSGSGGGGGSTGGSPGLGSDGDHDGVADDGTDKCTGQDSRKRDSNKNGCLDRELLDPDIKLYPGRCKRFPCDGLMVKRIEVLDVDADTKVRVACAPKGCKPKSKSVRRGRSRAQVKLNRWIDAKRTVKVWVSKKGAVGRYVSYRIGPNTYKRVPRSRPKCLKPGSLKPVKCGKSLWEK